MSFDLGHERFEVLVNCLSILDFRSFGHEEFDWDRWRLCDLLLELDRDVNSQDVSVAEESVKDNAGERAVSLEHIQLK